jgi:hypothetical protein
MSLANGDFLFKHKHDGTKMEDLPVLKLINAIKYYIRNDKK